MVRFFKGEAKASFERTTGEDGTFTVEGIAPGEWKVTAYPYTLHGASFSREITVRPKCESSMEMRIPDRMTYKIHGQVCGEFGEGLKAVTVEVNLGMHWAPHKRTTTDLGGRYGPMDFKVKLNPPKKANPTPNLSENWVAQSLAMGSMVCFKHPDYAALRIGFNPNDYPSGVIELNASFQRPGTVSGFVELSDGGNADGDYLPYSFKDENSSRSTGTIIKNNHFIIKIPRKTRLVIEDWEVGEKYIVAEKVDVGMVDTTTFRTGVKVRLRRIVRHFIRIVDKTGKLLKDRSVEMTVYAETERTKFSPNGLKAMATLYSIKGIIKLPLKLGKLKRLSVYGQGIVVKDIECSKDNIPKTIAIEFLPPLLTGTIQFPPGFKGNKAVQVQMKAWVQGSATTLPWRPLAYNPTTGAFLLERLNEEYSDSDGTGLNPQYKWKYTVSIRIPGYKPWVKENFRPKPDAGADHVFVSFEKN
jgi:hypothetical protein